MKKYIPVVLLCILTLFIAFSPIIPFVKGIWFINDPLQKIADKLITCLGILFTIIGAFLSLQLAMAKSDMTELGIHLKKQLIDNFRAEKVSSENFYFQFLAQAKAAKRSICISYLAPFPPSAPMRKERDLYYKEMDKLIQKVDGRIMIRRLVRWSEANRSWIEETLRKFETCPGFELAVLEDLDATKPMPLALSVQVIDGKHVWVVAASGHEQRGSERDLYIDSEIVATYIQSYFERLWHHATPLKDASHGITSAGHELLAGSFKKGAPL